MLRSPLPCRCEIHTNTSFAMVRVIRMTALLNLKHACGLTRTHRETQTHSKWPVWDRTVLMPAVAMDDLLPVEHGSTDGAHVQADDVAGHTWAACRCTMG